MPDKRLRTGLLSFRDPANKREWSGTIYYMNKALKERVGDVVPLGPLNPDLTLYILKAVNKLSLFFTGKNYNIAHSTMLAKNAGRIFSRMAKKHHLDLIVVVASTPGATFLKADVPVIIIDDITFSLLKENYSNYTNLLPFSERESARITDGAYKRADAVVFSSEWARHSAIKDNHLSPEKVHVISFGANLDRIPTREEALAKSTGQPCKILFLGVDWIRKGGDIAFEAFKMLDERGFDAEFTVCGCTPPSRFRHPKMKIIPFLDKNNPTDFKKLFKLLEETNFLLVPTRNDCTPIVFSEANSFGIPVVTTDTGGVSAVVSNGVNGYLLNEEDGGEAYADIIQKAYADEKAYSGLVASSRMEYENRLNWCTWAESIKELALHLLNGSEPAGIKDVAGCY